MAKKTLSKSEERRIALAKKEAKTTAPKAKKPKVVKEKKPKAPKAKKLDAAFHLSVSFNDDTFERDTDDIAGAMLELNPPQLKTKVIVKVTRKDSEREFVLFGSMARRIMINKIAAQSFDKRVKLAFDGE